MQTFVVRVFVPVEDGSAALRGVVEHVASGQASTFADPQGLLAFLDERVQASGQPKEDE